MASEKHYILHLARLRRKIRLSALPVVYYGHDAIFYTLNIGYGISVTQNGGCILGIQDTAGETHRYGLPLVSRLTFWTWPNS